MAGATARGEEEAGRRGDVGAQRRGDVGAQQRRARTGSGGSWREGMG
jgi:hypothetical protein